MSYHDKYRRVSNRGFMHRYSSNYRGSSDQVYVVHTCDSIGDISCDDIV